MDFIQRYMLKNKGSKIVKVPGRRCVPYELHTDAGEVLLTFTRWCNIVNTFIFDARERIVDGEALSMPCIGVIHGKRVQRNFRNKHINWCETKKQPMVYNPQTGRTSYAHKIYYSEDVYCRIGWTRTEAKTMSRTQIRRFKFVPTSSNSQGKRGFKTQFSSAQYNNPVLKLRYMYYPYKFSY